MISHGWSNVVSSWARFRTFLQFCSLTWPKANRWRTPPNFIFQKVRPGAWELIISRLYRYSLLAAKAKFGRLTQDFAMVWLVVSRPRQTFVDTSCSCMSDGSTKNWKLRSIISNLVQWIIWSWSWNCCFLFICSFGSFRGAKPPTGPLCWCQ